MRMVNLENAIARERRFPGVDYRGCENPANATSIYSRKSSECKANRTVNFQVLKPREANVPNLKFPALGEM